MKTEKLFFLLSLITLISCNSCPNDSLDEIKAYHPEDKYFKASMKSLHFITEVSSIAQVDSVFNNMLESYQLPVNANGAKDGTYTGASPYDAFDYKHVVEIEIKDEKIVSVDYDEIHKSRGGKQYDSVYCQEMIVTGTSPAIAYPKMEKQFLTSQDMMKVDAVSGATYSLYRFRYAATIALMKALL